ncbi:ribonuclease III domain-containing protein [Aspergillus crustosus]
MDRKRKSVFSSFCDENQPANRSKKTSANHSSKTYSLQDSLSHCDLETDLKNLRDLVERFPSYSENDVAKLNPDVLRATRDLSLALNKTLVVQKPTTNSTDRHHTTGSIELTRNYDNCLPSLPSIMDRQLEQAVFTHPGVGKDPQTTYDRLEILGDAYIELISTKLILNQFQQIPSGRISQIREILVKNETLADYATKYGLDSRASVPHDYSSQQKRWIKTRGDIFEAYVAAVILSRPDGYFVAEAWLSQLWSPKLESLEESASHAQSKQILAAKIMGKGVKLRYIDERHCIQHQGGTQTFFIGVYLTGWGWNNQHLGSGQGLNKSIAGNMAAEQALKNQALIDEIMAAKIKHAARGL